MSVTSSRQKPFLLNGGDVIPVRKASWGLYSSAYLFIEYGYEVLDAFNSLGAVAENFEVSFEPCALIACERANGMA
jgi:hypothetical protein